MHFVEQNETKFFYLIVEKRKFQVILSALGNETQLVASSAANSTFLKF